MGSRLPAKALNGKVSWVMLVVWAKTVKNDNKKTVSNRHIPRYFPLLNFASGEKAQTTSSNYCFPSTKTVNMARTALPFKLETSIFPNLVEEGRPPECWMADDSRRLQKNVNRSILAIPGEETMARWGDKVFVREAIQMSWVTEAWCLDSKRKDND